MRNTLSRFAFSQGLSQGSRPSKPLALRPRTSPGRRAQRRCSALRPWPRRTAIAPRFSPCDCPRPRHRTATPSSPCALTPLLRCRLLQVGRCSSRNRVPTRGGIKDEVRAPRILSAHASTPALGLVISPPPTPSTSLKPVCSVFLPALTRCRSRHRRFDATFPRESKRMRCRQPMGQPRRQRKARAPSNLAFI